MLRRRRNWAMWVLLARQGVALALSLLVFMSAAATASIPRPVLPPTTDSPVSLLFPLPLEDLSDQELRRTSLWPCAFALINRTYLLEHILPARRWSLRPDTHGLLIKWVSLHAERAPPA